MGISEKRALLCQILLAFILLSCGPESGTATGEPHYLLSLSLPEKGYYPFQVVSDLESGEASIGEARQVLNIPNNVIVTARQGFVVLNTNDKMTRYDVGREGTLEAKGSVPNTGLLGGPISAFLDDKRLLVSTAPRQVSDSLFSYQIVNIENMTIERTGKIRLQVKAGSMASPSMYIVREGKVLVPYIHADDHNHAYPRANLAIFSAETMALEKTISTDKTACLGYSVVSSHAMTENGDIYLISSNSNYWGANESLPSGIVRIKSGQTEFDDRYFLNLTARLNGNHSGGMILAEGHKAIVQVFESGLIKAYRDYQHGYVISYYEVDLQTQSLRKLEIPLSKYPRRAMERLKDGKVVIAINAGNGENACYIYDGRTGNVKKGLVYQGAEYLSGVVGF